MRSVPPRGSGGLLMDSETEAQPHYFFPSITERHSLSARKASKPRSVRQ